jgi:hypothetical protein
MKTRYALLTVLGLILTLCVSSARAGNPHAFPAYYNGGIVLLTLNTDAQAASQQTVASNLAIPLYLVVGQDISHVISSAPGQAGYSPFWAVYVVTVNDSSVLPLTSVADIQAAAALGAVTVSEQPVAVVLCPAVSAAP